MIKSLKDQIAGDIQHVDKKVTDINQLVASKKNWEANEDAQALTQQLDKYEIDFKT